MRRSIQAVMLWTAVMLLCISVQADVIIDSINYKLELGDFNGAPGSVVKMPLKLKNAVPIGGFFLRLEYDTTLLTPLVVPNGVTLYSDSLELVDRGLNTIYIDSSSGEPPWDTVQLVHAFHYREPPPYNAQAMFVSFMPPPPPGDGLREPDGLPNIPEETGDPSTILNLLFIVKVSAIPGQTGNVRIANHPEEIRIVQLTDIDGLYVIYPGAGPLFAEAVFTVDPVFCGDADGNGQINILDVSFLINYLYNEGSTPDPIERGDANGDGNINVLDVSYLINYLYKNGPPPVCP